MLFSQIYGNEDIKTALVKMVNQGRVPHAILLHDNNGGQALPLCQAFISYLFCTNKSQVDSCQNCKSCKQIDKYIHPNIHYTFPITSGTKVSGKVSDLVSNDYIQLFRGLATVNPYFLENDLTVALGIDKKTGLISNAEAKSILNELSMSTVADGYRVVVIYLPEKMNASAANSLLKEIEEPPQNTLFLMITHNPNDVMPTILSRCLRIRVQPSCVQDIVTTLVKQFGNKEVDAQRVASVANGSIGEAIELINKASFSVEMHNLFAKLMEDIINRDLLSVLSIAETVAELDSREQQKLFCSYIGDCLRKIFMYQQNIKEISGVSEEEDMFYNTIANKCSNTFPRKCMVYLDRAVMLIDRNVNQKIVFCNLFCKMFFSI